jgi:hypothetical protein
VADELEAESKTRLRTMRGLQEEYEAERDADRTIVDEKNRDESLAPATDCAWR